MAPFLFSVECTEIDVASLQRTKRLFADGRDEALDLLGSLQARVYDLERPCFWLLASGGQTSALLSDAMGKRQRAKSEGSPRALKILRGVQQLTAW